MRYSALAPSSPAGCSRYPRLLCRTSRRQYCRSQRRWPPPGESSVSSKGHAPQLRLQTRIGPWLRPTFVAGRFSASHPSAGGVEDRVGVLVLEIAEEPASFLGGNHDEFDAAAPSLFLDFGHHR